MVVPESAEQQRGVGERVELHWIEGGTPAHLPGAVCGVPWPRGVLQPGQELCLAEPGGRPVPHQSRPLAYWPDGSIKWLAVGVGPDAASPTLHLTSGRPAIPAVPVSVRETRDAVEIDTGTLHVGLARHGDSPITYVRRDGRPLAERARLVCLRQDRPDVPAAGTYTLEEHRGEIETLTVEQSGPVRATVCIRGRHRGPGARTWLPYVLRLYLHASSDAIRILHTFVFDGDPDRDFVRGLGLRFDVPLRDSLHDRHVRFAGQDGGLWAEAVRGLTGLRRDPGLEFRSAQHDGTPTPPRERLAPSVRARLDYIPAWSDYTLSQLTADGFEIRKRTGPDRGWVRADGGGRAAGLGYVGGVSGGVAFGLRDFWQRYPTQLDIRGAATDTAEVTLWLYAPQAPALDLRPYHDGMGMHTHAQQLEGLEITYEDYEDGYNTPVGIARTNEMTLWALGTTPPRGRLVELANYTECPPVLVCEPYRYVETGVLGPLFGPVDRSTPTRAGIEDRLDSLIRYYQDQVRQRRWYGFWDHGDVMHTYDADRHVWRYDVGGFAWDNSELSPDLWLWYSYLRSGRADVFRLAEAMTRHTGEVDVYHLGRFQGLGTRHGVQHWACSAKQVRISTAIYRRIYYYLTADERTGELMRELVDVDERFLTTDPLRKVRRLAYTPAPRALDVGLGTDWGSLAAIWLTEWERTGNERARQKLVEGMRSIGAMRRGFFGRGLYDPKTGAFVDDGASTASASPLSAVFGLFEVCAELVDLLVVPEFEQAWLAYCRLYSAGEGEQAAALGNSLGRLGLREAHSRLTGYAAWRTGDAVLARRAWSEILGDAPGDRLGSLETKRVQGPDVLNPVDEAPSVSTNDTAQWSLAAIQLLALVGDFVPEAR
jgi:hypothetical protein